MPRIRVLSPVVLGLGLTLLLASPTACQRRDPAALRVEGNDAGGLARWRHNVRDNFTRAEWQEFDEALQDLRLDITAGGEASGTAAIDAALLKRIVGKTRREVILLGAGTRVGRLARLRDELKEMVDGNALLVARPGDRDSARQLERISSAQQQRLRDLDAQLAAARERFAVLGGEVAPVQVTKGDAAKPANLSRAEASAQIEQLLANRRAQAALRFGAWPLKIDSEGAELANEERTDFLASRARAATNGHTVAAVRLKGRWWIHDAPIPPLEFSAAVAANLTQADRDAIALKWKTLSIELWARETAKKAEDAELDGKLSDTRPLEVTVPDKPRPLPRP